MLGISILSKSKRYFSDLLELLEYKATSPSDSVSISEGIYSLNRNDLPTFNMRILHISSTCTVTAFMRN